MTTDPMKHTASQSTLVDRDADSPWLRAVVERIVTKSHQAFKDRVALESQVAMSILAAARQELAKQTPVTQSPTQSAVEVGEDTKVARLLRREETVGWREEELEWRMKHADRREEHARLRDENSKRRDESVKREAAVGQREVQAQKKEAEVMSRHTCVLGLQKELDEKLRRVKEQDQSLVVERKALEKLRAEANAAAKVNAKPETDIIARVKIVEAHAMQNEVNMKAAEKLRGDAIWARQRNEAKQVQLGQMETDLARRREDVATKEAALAKRESDAAEREQTILRRHKEVMGREENVRSREATINLVDRQAALVKKAEEEGSGGGSES
ncbi:hypothetical protein FA95DRAFT_989829 [Auriscalpium vulgare]|uniref:Uncharacterized protein n=1 Tax=Auriscalpium vulgare TaxID=40419 RepID=A0ACB8RYD9_9AGAM|nr:hypothetical protein FA95DRAFT_989829 [Auriscalpium vulgare]